MKKKKRGKNNTELGDRRVLCCCSFMLRAPYNTIKITQMRIKEALNHKKCTVWHRMQNKLMSTPRTGYIEICDWL